MLSVSLSLGGAQTIVPGATLNVSADVNNYQSEMSLVINPTNPLNLIGFSHRIVPGAPITMDVYRSMDGGSTWTTTLIDNTDDGQGVANNRYDPAVAFDANGTLYIAYGIRGTAAPATTSRLIAATSTDGGLNFINFRQLDSQSDIGGAGGSPPGVDRWTLTTGRDPNSGNQAAYITYTQNATEGAAGTDQRIVICGTRDAGANWTAPAIINDGSISGTDTGNIGTSTAVSSGGEVFVTWWDGLTSLQADRDRDGIWANTFNFGTDLTVRTNAGLIDIGGNNTGPPAQPGRGARFSPSLAINLFNRDLYIACHQQVAGNDTNIIFGRSSDFGDTWTWSTVDFGSGTEFNPTIAWDVDSGALGVSYYTTEGDQSTGNDDVRPRMALSADNGNTWSLTFLSAQTSNEGASGPGGAGYGGDYLEYIGFAFRDGTAHCLWSSRYPGGGLGGTDLDAFTTRVSLDSATNGNVLLIGGIGGAPDDSIIIRRAALNNNFVEVFENGARTYTGLLASIDSITIETGGGVHAFDIENLSAIPVNMFGSSGVDTITISALSGVSGLTFTGAEGADTLTLGTGASDTNTITSPVTFTGGAGGDTLIMGSGNADAVAANVTFDGSTGGGNSIIYNDTTPNYVVRYDIFSNRVNRDGLNAPFDLFYSNVGTITANLGASSDTVTIRSGVTAVVHAFGNAGNDNFIVGGGNLNGFFPQDINGGPGTDTITYDDSANLSGKTWDIDQDTRPNEIIYSGLISLFTTGFESVGILGGTGQDEFDFKGVLGQSFNVDGGPNSDDFVLGYQGSVYFSNPVTLTGGTGADLYTVNDAAVSAFTTPLVMDGGVASEFNGLVVNEPLATGYYLGQGYFIPRTGASDQGVFSFANMTTTVITGTAGNNDFTVYSAGASIGTFTIDGGSGNDSFVLAPQLSGYSFKGLTINGQPGTDTFTFDASGLNTNETYTIGTNMLQIDRGSSTDTVTITSMDSVTLNCGLGNDTISMNQYSAGIPVTVNGGGGDDTMNFGGGDLPANITSISAFTFSGQTGHDTFNLNNGNRTDQWSYTNNTPTIQASDVSTGYSIGLGLSAVEQLNVNAGSGIDFMTLTAVPSGETLAFNGANGGDVINFPADLSTILGPVFFDGGGGSNNINQLTNSSATPATVHVDQTSVGAIPGDNFFPAGASLHFANVSYMTLTMGSGADTVYAQPNAIATVDIRGGSPTTAPGDTLNLDLASAVNFVITPTSPTSGNVTSDNLQTLTFSSFETIPNAPQFVEAISFTGAYSQNFDALPTSGTTLAWSNNSTLAGWSLYRQPTPGTAISTINAGTGSSSTGSFYSFGVLGSGPLTDRALGGVGSSGTYFGGPLAGAVAGWLALALTNDTGAPINTLSLGYDGEQWRDGGNTSPQVMKLEYGFGNSFTTVPTWTAPGGSYDFTSPIHTATAAALDGNAASNRTAGLGGTLNNLGWAAGSTLWVRWIENNDAGNDHALAVDNVQFSLPSAFFGDFNADGSIDAADFVVWRKSLGTNGVPAYSGADGDGDGMIDQDDYGVLRAHFGKTLPPPGAGSGAGSATASEALVAPVDESKVAETSMRLSVSQPNQSVQGRGSSGEWQAASQRSNLTSVVAHVFSPFATFRPAVRGSFRFKSAIAERRRDEALGAWLTSQPATTKQYDDFAATESWASEDVSGTDEVHLDSVEQVFALLAGS